MLKHLVIVAAVILGFGQQGPPGYKPGHGTSSPTKREEPAWAISKLENTRNDFHKAREAIQRECGVIVGGTFVSKSESANAYADYKKGKRLVDAYKALYLYIASGDTDGGPVGYEALWNVLPKDEYEVARLHFLWAAPEGVNALAQMGDRLLAKDPNDIEVMHYEANLRTQIIPDRDLKKALNYEARVLKEAPCAWSYLRYAMIQVYVADANKDLKAGAIARQYIDKFKATASKKDSFGFQRATSLLARLKKLGY